MSFAWALLSAAIYGVSDFLGGLASRRAAVFTVTFASQLVGLLGLGLGLALGFGGEAAPRDLAWGAGAGVSGGVGVALLYRGLARGTASVVAPVTALCAMALPVAFGVVWLGERPSWTAVVGVVLAAVAVALLSQGPGPDTSTPEASAERARPRAAGVPLALTAGVAIGAFLVCLGRTRAEAGLWPLVAARVVSVAGLGILVLGARAPMWPPRPALAPTVSAGALDLAANGLYMAAAQRGALGLVATLASLYPASTVALAHLVLGERLRGPQRMGLVLALVALVLITLPS